MSNDTGTEATISPDAELEKLREGIDDPMVLKDQLGKEANARRQITARAIKAEEKAEELKRELAELKAKSEPITTQPSQEQATPTLNDEVVDLRLDGYSKKEVEWIMANGGRKVLDDPNSFVTIAIKAQREQLKAEQAASAVGDTSALSDIERKYTPEQLRNMSPSELEKILPHA